MSSTFRIPKARITGLYGRVLAGITKRMWGRSPTTPTCCGTIAAC